MAQEEVMRNLLLRFGNSLASGEAESAFLRRELQVLMQDYVNDYERDLESLRKWTDAFVALEATAIMIVLVAIVSNMIYNLGPLFLVVTEVGVLGVSVLGAWLVRRVAPFDPMVQKAGAGSQEPLRLRRLAAFLTPISLVGTAGTYSVTHSMGVALVVMALFLAPLGVYVYLLERKVHSRDRDIADFVRSLGGVTAARGSTVADSLRHMDRRSIGSLEPELRRLLQRLDAGVDSARAWARFIGETSSDLVKRVVSAFWDAVRMGGDPAIAGNLAADLGLQAYLLRSRRRLVSSTFHFVIIPLHAILSGLLLFVNEVVTSFNAALSQAQNVLSETANISSVSLQEVGIPTGLAFHNMDTGYIATSVTVIALALTVINSLVAQIVSGGSPYKIALYGALTGGATGLALTLIPILAQRMFGGITLT